MTELSKFGKYELRKFLRREGDFIEVYEAFQPLFDRQVELRLLTLAGKSGVKLGERFLHEVKLLSRIDHPSVVTVLDAGSEEGKLFYTTSLHPNMPLADFLKGEGDNMSPSDTVRLGEVLVDGLAHIHKEGIIHRGISDRSIFIYSEDKLPFFGECSVLKDIRIRKGLSARGVPSLADVANSPEELLNEACNEATDVYLVSALLFRILTGVEARPVGLPQKFRPLYMRFGDGTAEAKESLKVAGVPTELAQLIMRNLSFVAEERCQSAAALGDELRKLAKKLEVKLYLREQAAITAATAHPRPTIPKKKKRIATAAPQTSPAVNIWGPLAVFVTLLVALGWYLFSSPKHQNGTLSSASSGPRVRRVLDSSKKWPAKSQLAGDLSGHLLAIGKRKDFAFTVKWSALRRWLRARGKSPEGVGSYKELLELRVRHSKKDDKAKNQLDEWIKRACLVIEAEKKAKKHG